MATSILGSYTFLWNSFVHSKTHLPISKEFQTTNWFNNSKMLITAHLQINVCCSPSLVHFFSLNFNTHLNFHWHCTHSKWIEQIEWNTKLVIYDKSQMPLYTLHFVTELSESRFFCLFDFSLYRWFTHRGNWMGLYLKLVVINRSVSIDRCKIDSNG